MSGEDLPFLKMSTEIKTKPSKENMLAKTLLCCPVTSKRKFFILCLSASIGLVLFSRHLKELPGYYGNIRFITRAVSVEQSQGAEPRVSVSCKLPELDPFHPEIMKVMKDTKPLVCKGSQYSRLVNGTLYVNLGNVSHKVWYRDISRVDDYDDRDFKVQLGEKIRVEGPVGEIELRAPVKSEFIQVSIAKGNYDNYINEYHLQVVPKEEVRNRTVKNVLPLNIFIIMFDSTSAAQFKRKMKRTLDFLSSDLDTVFFKGESVVGDGTTAQVTAMLTGIAEEEQPEARRGKVGAKNVDRWNWIFRDFKDHGYATMFSEDDPYLAAFNYRLEGFGEQPTDHYARPFWIRLDEQFVRSADDKYCLGDRAIHNVSFNYLEDFANTYHDRPKLGVLFFSYLTHGDEDSLGYADEDLVRLLKNLNEKSHLNDSMIVIMGDHGFRFGSWRATTHGKLEERLPYLSITMPHWFRLKYPHLYHNMKHNSEVLTSPFDLHATFKHILTYPSQPRDIKTGQSLFNRIDKFSRTCDTAGIAVHWCPCMTWENLDIDNKLALKITENVLQYINNITFANSQMPSRCHYLKVKEIKTFSKEIPNEKVVTFVESKKKPECDSCGVVHGEKSRDSLDVYQIQFVATPGEGIFEASVHMHNGNPVVDSRYISRINEYGDQSHCVKDQPHLLKFCFCR